MYRNVIRDKGRTNHHSHHALHQFSGQVERNQGAYKHQPELDIPAFQHGTYQLAGRADHPGL
jgi:hypothetical protein